MKQFAVFLSWLFHPLMIVSYATALYFFVLPSDISESYRFALIVLGMIVTGTLLLPATIALMMLRLGRIGSMQMERREERNWPLLQSAVVYFTCYYALSVRQVPDFVQLFLLGAAIAMVLGLIINLKWKVSLHMIGAGGLCGGLAGFFFFEGSSPVVLATCFLLAGVLGSARLLLDSHTPGQVIAGFAAGFAAEFGIFLLLY